MTGVEPALYNADILDEAALDKIFSENSIDSVIHFAALKAVGESGEIPLDYWKVNVQGSLTLLRSMQKHNVQNIVFSSSATVYGDATRVPGMIPIPEHCPIGPTNVYGQTKVAVEDMITAQIKALNKKAPEGKKFNAALLRYFNPAGAHPSGIMGEDPQGVPYNLLPLLAQVAVGKREKLLVFGDGKLERALTCRCVTNERSDYSSHDGTAIRDYIHILDLSNGHLTALNYLRDHQPGVKAWNLGTGRGSTVYEMIKSFSTVVGRDLPYEVAPRRDGDVLNLTADATRAKQELKWTTKFTLEDACADLWRWTENNPQGYRQQPPKEFLDKISTAK